MKVKALKNVIGWAVVTALLAGIGVLSVLGCTRKSLEDCDGVEISFKGGLSFLTVEEVQKLLEDEYGTFKGLKRDSVELAGMEKLLKSDSSVKECEAWISRDSRIHIDITSRMPVVMFKNGSVRFYADEDCFIFPTRGKTMDVPVISGNLPISEGAGYSGPVRKPEEKRWMEGVMELMNYIESSHRWKGKVTEFCAGRNCDMTIGTEMGKEKINIGYPDKFENKFRRIEDYYNIIVPEKGENYYKKVDVKYNKQIICRRDI